MGMLRPPPGVAGPTLDVQVLEGLETYIATDKFLHKLEAASAEWIDLSDNQQQHHPHASPHQQQPELELSEASHNGVVALQHDTTTASSAAKSSMHCPASQQPTRSGFFSRWRSSAHPSGGTSSSNSSNAGCAAEQATGRSSGNNQAAYQAVGSPSRMAASSTGVGGDQAVAGSHGVGLQCADDLPPVVMAASCFELVGPQPPLTDSLMQEPFVLVSAEDAIESMAYYIALYLSRAPEARYMEPKQLQAALRQTFTAIRRSRYRAIWDWGRCLYRWGAVSYSALQLYEHPWVVRAVVAAVWASSKMALGFLW